MVTFAQAQERAERWVNGEMPAYQHREVRLREFGLGFVAWAEDRTEGPTSDGGRARLVVARESGATTLWPGLPVDEVVRRYEEEYGETSGRPSGPAQQQGTNLEATSFLLSPPDWLQDAADQMGVPDRRDAGSAPSAPAAPAAYSTPGEESGAGASGTSDASGGSPWDAADTSGSGSGAAQAPPATVFAPPLGGSEEGPPARGLSEAKTELTPDGSVLPRTTVAPAVDDPNASQSQAQSQAQSQPPQAPQAPGQAPGPGAPQTPQAPPVPGTPPAPPADAPQAPNAPGTPGGSGGGGEVHHAATMLAGGPSAPPPGGPSAPPPPGAPPAPGSGGSGSAGGGYVPTQMVSADELEGELRSSGRYPAGPGDSPGASQAPQAPDAPGTPHAPQAPNVPNAPGTPGGSGGGGDVHHAATMLADPSAGGPGGPGDAAGSGSPGGPRAPGTPPPPPGAPGVPGAGGSAPPRSSGAGAPPPPGAPPAAPPAPSAPGAPQAPNAPNAPNASGTPGGSDGAGSDGGGSGSSSGSGGGGDVHQAATMLAGPEQAGSGTPPPAAPTAPAAPGAPGQPQPQQPPGPPFGAPGAPPGAPPAAGPGPGPAPGYGYPQPPTDQPTVGPGYMAVLRYRAPDGSEQQLIRRSAPGTPHPEWQLLHELRSLNVPPQQVLELHTELESCELPGGYCARMVRENWPQVRVTHTAPYGRDHASRQQGMRHLIEHQGELHQVADGPARPAPNRVALPPQHQIPPVPPIPPDGIAYELSQAFGPQALFRFDQQAVSRQGVPDAVGQTLVWAGLPVDVTPFFWAQAQPGRPVPTLAELAQERGAQAGSDAGSYLVMGNDFGRQICVQYGTAHIVAVPVEAEAGGQPAPAQFVSTGLPEFARCLALLGRMWPLRYGLTQEQAGRWTVDFQGQLAALDPAALSSPESWWSVLLEQMWDGLF